MTGFVTDFELDGQSYSMLLNADGSRRAGTELVSLNGTYYVLSDALLYTGEAGEVELTGWSMLSAADRKILDHLYVRAQMLGEESLCVLVHADGSVAANEITETLHYTNKLGVALDTLSPFFKFGGKWYTGYDDGQLLGLSGPVGARNGVVRVKATGELIGIFDPETDAPLSGIFGVVPESGDYSNYYLICLKNGMLQTGKHSEAGYTFYFDPDLGINYDFS